MFKGKIKIWAWVFIGCFVANWILGLMGDISAGKFKKTPINISFDVSSTNNIAEKLNLEKTGKFKIMSRNYLDTSGDVEIIISENNNIYQGYDMIENGIYSPLVLYGIEVIRDEDSSSLFWGASTSSYSPWSVDLLTILEAIEGNKTWEDLGVSKKVHSGPIELYISAEQSGYYDEIVELFYATLNGGKLANELDREKLAPRVNALLAKCHKTADVHGILSEAANKHDKKDYNGVIAIAPEYMYISNQRAFSAPKNSTSFYTPYYMKSSLNIYANVYLKSGSVTAQNFLSTIQERTGFLSACGWRVRGATYDARDVSTRFISVPSTIN